MAVRAPILTRAPTFEDQLAELAPYHELIRDCVEEFCDTLLAGYLWPHLDLISTDPNVYAYKLDYRPFGERGKGRFRVTLVAKRSTSPMREPDRFGLLTIALAHEHLN